MNLNRRNEIPPLKYLSLVGDTYLIEKRDSFYLIKFWDRDWGRCIGSETDATQFPYPPDYLWYRMGEYIMDDFGNLTLKNKCYNSGRSRQDMTVWGRDFYTGVMKAQYV